MFTVAAEIIAMPANKVIPSTCVQHCFELELYFEAIVYSVLFDIKLC